MLFTKRTVGTVAYLGGLPAVLESFAWAWGQMIQYNSEYLCQPGEIIHYDHAPVSLHDVARNYLVDKMQGDWLLQLDTDHTFDPDLVARMVTVMNQRGIDVGVGVYRHRTGIKSPVLYKWTENQAFAQPIVAWDPTFRTMEIGTAGGGCHLVRRSVYDKIRTELRESPYSRFANMGEDHSFYKRCAQIGVTVHALLQIEAPHLETRPMLMSEYVQPEPDSLQLHETEGYLH